MTYNTIGARLDGRNNNFTAVRIVASTTVLFSHAFLVSVPGQVTSDYPHFLGFSPGFHAVHVFFVLSGFFLTKSLLSGGDVIAFGTARVLRLMPAIALSALVMALVVGPMVTTTPLSEYFTSGQVPAFVMSITMLTDVSHRLPGVFDGNVVSGDIYELLWTLRYEYALCIGLAMAFVLGLMNDRRLFGAAFVGVLVLFCAGFWNGIDEAPFAAVVHLARFSTAFAIGMAAYVFRDRIPHSAGLLLVLAVAAFAFSDTGISAPAGILLLSYAVLFAGFARLPWLLPLNWLGQGSYGVYVFGFAVLQLVHMFQPELGAWSTGLVAWLITMPLATLSWHVFEKPILRYRRPISAAIRSAPRKLRDVLSGQYGPAISDVAAPAPRKPAAGRTGGGVDGHSPINRKLGFADVGGLPSERGSRADIKSCALKFTGDQKAG